MDTEGWKQRLKQKSYDHDSLPSRAVESGIGMLFERLTQTAVFWERNTDSLSSPADWLQMR